MSYQGVPGPGDGYGDGYGIPGSYPSQAPQGYYQQQNAPEISPGYAQGRINMQQLQAMHAQNQAAFHQNQYTPVSYVSGPEVYYQAPSIQQQQYYPQYIEPSQVQRPFQQVHQVQPQYQQQYRPSQSSFIPQYDGPIDQPLSMAQVPQHNAPKHSQTPVPLPPKRSFSQSQKPKKPSIPSTDTSTLLLSLAEEYFAAAHGIGPAVAQNMTEDAVDTYQNLIATALACLETTLSKGDLPPRLEAKVRLRYASVLFEETENFMEAETALSKGITLCDQNKYFDLKYNMQLLLAKLMFGKSPKAALKALDSNIAEVEAYKYHSWIYVFRFLRATLSLQTGKASDAHAALQNLRAISKIAGDRGDHPIFMTASLMESLACLHLPGPESTEQVQRALASAHMNQLDPECMIPPLQALRHILDVSSSMLLASPADSLAKLRVMQTYMDAVWKDNTAWPFNSSSVAVPICKSSRDSDNSSEDTASVLGKAADGRDLLILSFLEKADVFILLYLLSGVVFFHKNSTDNKAVKYLERGLNAVLDLKSPRKEMGQLPTVIAKLHWRGTLVCYFYIYLVFCAAALTEWKAANDHLVSLHAAIRNLGISADPILHQFLTYLTGVIYQGSGDVEKALDMYQIEVLRLPSPTPITTPDEQVNHDLRILATLNSLWILQCEPDRDLAQNTAKINALEPLCRNHSNRNIQIIFGLVRATLDTDPATPNLKVKEYLKLAFDGSKVTANIQTLSITLSIMCNKYFTGVVGEQAEKSAMAASIQAKKSKNILWQSVADSMFAAALETQGKRTEAQQVRAEASRLAEKCLPGLD